ncbi:PTS transporter subunit EIIC [Terribacillus saccharophilus]|uniref:PTS sugar transporter subunit IIC n=1 Tax=Terribacillus saccharophilus TaxID=361277 RepID=A0A268AF49_9BACI|nr:PTS transporter subunit EIIC [Terribacillus saccharophilus]PAD22745.1 PTS sugar transporter subunit IIC [Terribacillus saccharophilus]PAF23647.1 PTS sugar transporter subunit IIC [Terribacillus saccharophilus]PAF39850.1 PTS sugar transporter subunit IIC [Terribacillus saccharophilus]
MAKMKQLAEDILREVGGEQNVVSLTHCMTRVRLRVRNDNQVNFDALKRIDGVMGVVADDTIQIVVGPGTVNKVSDEISRITGLGVGEEAAEIDDLTFEEKAQLKRENMKEKNKTPIKFLLKRIGNIFIPLIPGLIASGIINGGVSFAVNAGADPTLGIIQILQLIGGSLFSFLAILVGWNTAKEFGGSPVLGAIAGMILFNPALANITLFGEALVPGRGGLFGVIFAAWLMSFIEKRVRKFMPNSIDIIFTPILTVLFVGVASLLVIMPVAGVMSDGITSGINAILDVGGVVAGALLAGFFLPLVMVGLHHGLTPIHMELIQTFSFTALLPVLAMAGGGQVGASIAVFVKTRNKRLRNIIKGALPAGFLGIGEPLLYGVTLPLGRPFLTACLGAAVGGATQALFATGATSIGVSGLSLTPLIAEGKYLQYLIGIFVAYIAGFVFTYFFGFKEDMAKEI